MKKIWIPVTVLVLAALACSLPGGGGNATPTRETEVTQAPSVEQPTAAPTPESGGEVPAPQVAEDALAGLDSYRARMISQWTPAGGTPEGTTLLEEYTRDPAAHRVVIEGPEGTVEIVQIGDTGWFCTNGECMQSAQDEEDILSDMGATTFDPADFTSGTDYTYKGEETVNGIRARCYALDLSAAEIAAMAQGSVTDVQANACIAAQSGLPEFVVRYQMGWKETRDDTEGTTEFSFEVYDVNRPFTIEPPEGAAGLPEDVPAYPGASELMMMEGFISFSTTDDVATVADFYGTGLPTQGWTKEEDTTLEGMVSQTWTKDDRTLNLMISAGEGGKISVLIILE